MRPGRLIWVLSFTGMFAFAAPHGAPEATARARQLMESGVALERQGLNQRAIEVFTQAIKTGALSRPDSARAVFDRGVAYDALGKTNQAIAEYSMALRYDHSLAAALNNRANAYRRLGRLEEAKRDYVAALKTPGAAREYSYFGLGLVAQQLGDTESARTCFQNALAINPSFALAAQSLAGLAKPAEPIPPPAAASHTASAPFREPVQPPAPAIRAVIPPPQQAAKRAGGEQNAPVLRQAVSEAEERNRGGTMVQLGAYRDEQSANEGWNKIAAASQGALEGYTPRIVIVDIPGKGRYWRLRTAVADKAAARKLCSALASMGLSCMLAKD